MKILSYPSVYRYQYKLIEKIVMAIIVGPFFMGKLRPRPNGYQARLFIMQILLKIPLGISSKVVMISTLLSKMHESKVLLQPLLLVKAPCKHLYLNFTFSKDLFKVGVVKAWFNKMCKSGVKNHKAWWLLVVHGTKIGETMVENKSIKVLIMQVKSHGREGIKP